MAENKSLIGKIAIGIASFGLVVGSLGCAENAKIKCTTYEEKKCSVENQYDSAKRINSQEVTSIVPQLIYRF